MKKRIKKIILEENQMKKKYTVSHRRLGDILRSALTLIKRHKYKPVKNGPTILPCMEPKKMARRKKW